MAPRKTRTTRTRNRLLAVAAIGVGAALIAAPAMANGIGPFSRTAAPAVSTGAAAVPNLALNKATTGTASCRTGETPAKAVNGTLDGGLADKWCSSVRRPSLTIDLGGTFDLTSVTVDHAESGGEAAVMNTRAFDIRVSTDGQKFTTAAQVRGNAKAETVSTVNVSAQYVQILVRTPEQRRGGAARIYEVSVAGADQSTAPTPSTDPTPSSNPTATPTAEPTPTSSAPTATPTKTTQPTQTAQPTQCHSDAPATLTDYISDHKDALTRVSCNADVAVYFDNDLKAQAASSTAWISPFATDVWKYMKSAYGACATDRKLAAPVGPGCENFGAPKPALFFLHKGKHGGGTVNNRFDANSGFRTTIDAGDGSWDQNNGTIHDVLVHEACHQVEGASQGTHESPAFPIWGDSKWAEFCVHDFYANTGRTADAERTLKLFSGGKDNLPAGAKNAAWFRDWFLPLWEENGKSADVMERYFGLVAQYFPTRTENDGKNLIYTRRMNAGEYVLFTSAAAGKDLSARAAQAFDSGFSQAQFDQARKDFPQLKF